jgi:hypothetical protein
MGESEYRVEQNSKRKWRQRVPTEHQITLRHIPEHHSVYTRATLLTIRLSLFSNRFYWDSVSTSECRPCWQYFAFLYLYITVQTLLTVLRFFLFLHHSANLVTVLRFSLSYITAQTLLTVLRFSLFLHHSTDPADSNSLLSIYKSQRRPYRQYFALLCLATVSVDPGATMTKSCLFQA